MAGLSVDAAREVFQGDLLAEDAASALLGASCPPAPRHLDLDRALAAQARSQGALLVYRPARLADGRPVTLELLVERTRALGRPDLAFASKDPWFLADPGVVGETPEQAWALVAPEPWPETLGLPYDAAARALAARAAPFPWRRRRAVETVFDVLVAAHARGRRLLERSYDWTSTRSSDGGWVYVGGLGAAALEVASFSAPIRHGRLGSCPTLILSPSS